QGGAYLGKESPLGIELKLSRTIDATAQPITSNLVIVDKKNVINRTGDVYEKARRGELSASEAFTVAGGIRRDLGIGLDVTEVVNNIASTIGTASGVVDTLRQHGIQNIGELGKAFSGEVDTGQLFNDLMKTLAGEKKN
ncbi:MAG: hypothetical protein AABW61_01005, partial [Candidatus Aenigmatarchaeota archaeon]